MDVTPESSEASSTPTSKPRKPKAPRTKAAAKAAYKANKTVFGVPIAHRDMAYRQTDERVDNCTADLTHVLSHPVMSEIRHRTSVEDALAAIRVPNAKRRVLREELWDAIEAINPKVFQDLVRDCPRFVVATIAKLEPRQVDVDIRKRTESFSIQLVAAQRPNDGNAT